MLNLDHLPKTATLLNRPVPEMLHHYTNAGGLIPIIESGTFWGGLPQQMNDGEEISRAFRWLNLIADQFQFALRDDRGRGEEFLFARWVSLRTTPEDLGYLIRDSLPTYVISLSDAEDSLPQWRGYAPRSGGYCLSLPGGLLSDAAQRSNWLLAPCIYTEDDVEAMVRELYDCYLDRYRTAIARPTSDPVRTAEELEADNDTLCQVVAELRDEARCLAHFIKNPRFEQEREWRLLAFDHDPSPDSFRYIAGAHGLRMFLPFDYLGGHPRSFEDKPRPRLRIGPNAQPEGAKRVAVALLEKLVGVGNTDVFTHGSQYR